MNPFRWPLRPWGRALGVAAALLAAPPTLWAQGAAAPVSASAPAPAPALSAAQAEGQQLYGVHCIYCHGAGPGRAGTTALARRIGAQRSVLENRSDLDGAYVQVIVRHGLNAMLPLRRTELSDAELGRIVEWLQRPRAAAAAQP